MSVCGYIHTHTQGGCIYTCVYTQDLAEGRGQCQTRLACFKRGKVINIPANRVQVSHIKDTSAVYAAHTKAAHTEEPLIMETEDVQRVICLICPQHESACRTPFRIGTWPGVSVRSFSTQVTSLSVRSVRESVL